MLSQLTLLSYSWCSSRDFVHGLSTQERRSMEFHETSRNTIKQSESRCAATPSVTQAMDSPARTADSTAARLRPTANDNGHGRARKKFFAPMRNQSCHADAKDNCTSGVVRKRAGWCSRLPGTALPDSSPTDYRR